MLTEYGNLEDTLTRQAVEYAAPSDADLQQMHEDADKVQVRLDEYEKIQGDMLTAYGDMDDEVDRLKQQAVVDAAYSHARIRGLETQVEVQKETAEERQKELDEL